MNEGGHGWQAMDTMEKYKYSARCRSSRRQGVTQEMLTEAAICGDSKNKTDHRRKRTGKIWITEIPRRPIISRYFQCGYGRSSGERSVNQNFVPVLDDQKILSVLLPEKMLSVTFVKSVHNDRSVFQRRSHLYISCIDKV